MFKNIAYLQVVNLFQFRTSRKKINDAKFKYCHVSFVTLFFFNKNVVYKNIEAKICQIFKNILRIYHRLRLRI